VKDRVAEINFAASHAGLPFNSEAILHRGACYVNLIIPQEDLVARSKITKKTIADVERGATHPRAQTLAQLTLAFQAAGIRVPQY
jgi:predicted transcriptional regulator